MELQSNQNLSISPNTVLFIDEGIDNLQTLINQPNNHQIELLDSSQDGVKQMTSALSKYQHVERVGLLTHGNSGVIQLGNTVLNKDNINDYIGDFNGWSSSLDADADLLIFSCNVAANPDGKEFLKKLSDVTGADIAASIDMTGSSENSNWVLEFETGSIENNDVQINEAWSGELLFGIDIPDELEKLIPNEIESSVESLIDNAKSTVSSLYSEVIEFIENPIDYIGESTLKYLKGVFKEVGKLIEESKDLIQEISSIDEFSDVIDILSQTINVLIQTGKVYVEITTFSGSEDDSKSNPGSKKTIRKFKAISNESSELVNLAESISFQLLQDSTVEQKNLIMGNLEYLKSKTNDLQVNLNDLNSIIDPKNEITNNSSQIPEILDLQADDIRINRNNKTLSLEYSVTGNAKINDDVHYIVSFLDSSNNNLGNPIKGKISINSELVGQNINIPIQNYLGINQIPYGANKISVTLDSNSKITESNEDNNTIVYRNIYKLIYNEEILKYLASNPELIQSIGTNLKEAKKHYIQYGFHEGRSTDSFNAERYLASHGDLIQAFGFNPQAALQHYVQYGFHEGRSTDSFNAERYLASHGDLIQAFGFNPQAALQHYVQYGFHEGRSTDSFNAERYLASHGDLIQAFGFNPQAALQHYVQYGFHEGRPTDAFNEVKYLNKYVDLQMAFGNNSLAAIEHYIKFGFFESRSDS